MSGSHIEKLMGRTASEETAEAPPLDIAAEIQNDIAEPALYRSYLLKPRAQMAFALIEKDGTLHGFMYHQLRHPKHEQRGGKEYLSFTADSAAVVIQGTGLRVIVLGMLRHCLAEVREYDGNPSQQIPETRIDRLEVIETRDRQLMPLPHLVK